MKCDSDRVASPHTFTSSKKQKGGRKWDPQESCKGV